MSHFSLSTICNLQIGHLNEYLVNSGVIFNELQLIAVWLVIHVGVGSSFIVLLIFYFIENILLLNGDQSQNHRANDLNHLDTILPQNRKLNVGVFTDCELPFVGK